MAIDFRSEDEITDLFATGVEDYWSGIIPDEFYSLDASELADRTNLSPYMLGWMTAGDLDNGIGFFADRD